MFAGDLLSSADAASGKKFDKKFEIGAVTVDRIDCKAALNRDVLQEEIKAVA